MQTTAVAARQRQIRGFVIIWLGVTLLMGALTFAGIYYATGLVNNNDHKNPDSVAVVPNLDEPDSGFDLSQISTTPVPTAVAAALVPAPDNTNAAAVVEPIDQGDASDETQAEASVAAAPEGQGGGPAEVRAASAPAEEPAAAAARQDATPVPSPTPRPMDDPSFQVGIQVAPSHEPDIQGMWMTEVRDKLRLGWMKQQVIWEDVEPQPGQYNWARSGYAAGRGRRI